MIRLVLQPGLLDSYKTVSGKPGAVQVAMTDALDNVHSSIRSTFQKAVLSQREDAIFEDVVFACALVDTDEHGTFRATDLVRVFATRLGGHKPIQAFQYHLGRLCLPERGEVLERVAVGRSGARYRIRNPLFRAFVRLRYFHTHEEAAA